MLRHEAGMSVRWILLFGVLGIAAASAQPLPEAKPDDAIADVVPEEAPPAPVERTTPEDRPEEVLTVDGAYGISDDCVAAEAPGIDVIRIADGAIHDTEQSCRLAEREARDDGVVRFRTECNGGRPPADGFYYDVGDGRLLLDYGAGSALWRRCTR